MLPIVVQLLFGLFKGGMVKNKRDKKTVEDNKDKDKMQSW